MRFYVRCEFLIYYLIKYYKPLQSFYYTNQIFSCYTAPVMSTYKSTTVKSDKFVLTSTVFYHIILLLGEYSLLGQF